MYNTPYLLPLWEPIMVAFSSKVHKSNIARDGVEGAPQNLFESVAELITSTALTKFLCITAVRLKVGRPHVAVLGPVDYLGVEIVR
ncbi:hypothetical protein LguiB_013051 [Lonicera macranthoides]